MIAVVLILLGVNCFYLDFSILTNPREMLQVNSSVKVRYYISDIVVTVEVVTQLKHTQYLYNIYNPVMLNCLMLGHAQSQ